MLCSPQGTYIVFYIKTVDDFLEVTRYGLCVEAVLYIYANFYEYIVA